jgi:hypothetical protein
MDIPEGSTMEGFSKVVIGIDPGVTGAVARLGLMPDSSVCLLEVLDTPVVSVKKGKSYRSEYQAPQMFGWLATISSSCPAFGVIESQNAMPGQGVSSTFKIGYGYGLWIMALTAAGIPFVTVHPRVWKKFFMLDGQKGASIIRASSFFPQNATEFSRKKDAGRAEAALIALWAIKNSKV